MKIETNLGNGKHFGAMLMLLLVAREVWVEESPLEVGSYCGDQRQLVEI